MTRLPVQHPNAPHCPKCKRDLPNLNDVTMIMPGDVTCEIFATTFHIRCQCGALWNLYKTIA
jgi:hypothetical protein